MKSVFRGFSPIADSGRGGATVSMAGVNGAGVNGASVLTGLVLFLALLPILSLVWLAAGEFFGDAGAGAHARAQDWAHVLNHVLPHTLADTIGLLVLTCIFSGVLGLASAWLTSFYSFFGRTFFIACLMLPLAVPPYIAAYCMVEIWDYSGPVQTLWRRLGGGASFPDIRSLWGGGLIFSFVLYPYVYLAARLSFAMQGRSATEAGRSLGASSGRVFAQISLPLARPAIAVGLTLVVMETLNDIGAVEYLGIRTFTFTIFETWLNRHELGFAVQLSLLVLVPIAFLIFLERRGRRHIAGLVYSCSKPPNAALLSPWRQVFAFSFCGFVLLCGFGAPIAVLARYVWRDPGQIFGGDLWAAFVNSAMVGAMVVIAVLGLVALLLLTARAANAKAIIALGRFAGLGYALPGTILALGLLYALTSLDNALAELVGDGWTFGLLFSGSVFIIVYACSARFFAIAWGPMETALARLSPNIDMAARALGKRSGQIARQVHIPLLKPTLGACALLVFVETCKELPATLLVRPIGFETLATLIYEKASQTAIEEGAFASLAIIGLGLVPVVYLSKTGLHGRREPDKVR